jgi:hypothetical protein
VQRVPPARRGLLAWPARQDLLVPPVLLERPERQGRLARRDLLARQGRPVRWGPLG